MKIPFHFVSSPRKLSTGKLTALIEIPADIDRHALLNMELAEHTVLSDEVDLDDTPHYNQSHMIMDYFDKMIDDIKRVSYEEGFNKAKDEVEGILSTEKESVK